MAAQLEEQHLATVGALAAALEAKDAYTGSHAQAIAEFAVAVGEELGLPGPELRAVRMGALLHDVGKIGIPESILNKPGPLTDDEFTVMKRHTVIGADIVAGIPGMEQVVRLVRSSHERWDGRGYPDGLSGTDVPTGAYVIAVCDAYHAMTEDRVYRRAMSSDGASRRASALLGHAVHAPSGQRADHGRRSRRPRVSSASARPPEQHPVAAAIDLLQLGVGAERRQRPVGGARVDQHVADVVAVDGTALRAAVVEVGAEHDADLVAPHLRPVLRLCPGAHLG